MKTTLLPVALAAALLAGACASESDDGGPGGGGGGPGGPDDVGGAVEDGLSRWSVESNFDLSVTMALPGANSALELITRFNESPTEVIMDLAKELPGGEVVGFIDMLPGFIKDRIFGWIDEAILGVEVGGVNVTDQLATIADIVDRLAADAVLTSQLEIEAISTDGDADARHRLEAITFSYEELSTTINRGRVPEAATTMTPLTATRAALALSLTEHELGVPLGAFATLALDWMLEQRFGVEGGIDGVFAAIIPCDTIAEQVANRCALGQCVGHENEIKLMCEFGLRAVGTEVEKRLHGLSYALRLEGDATLGPAGNAPRVLTDGTWAGVVQMGPAHENLPGTFSGNRMVGANPSP